MTKMQPSSTSLPHLLTNRSGSPSLTIEGQGHSTSLIISIDVRNSMEIGDRIYFNVSFKVDPVPVQNVDFNEWFRFKTYPDGADLKVWLETPMPTTIPVDTGLVNLTYLAILSEVAPGQNFIDVTGYTADAKTALVDETGSLGESDKFYVRQSLASALQKNVVTDGGADVSNAPFKKSVDIGSEMPRNASFMPIGLQPINPANTKDVSFWTAIRNGTDALSYVNYSAFMDFLFCGGINPFSNQSSGEKYRETLGIANERLALPFNNVDAYRALKVATEAFVMATISVAGDPDPGLKSEFRNYEIELQPFDGNVEKNFRVIPYLAIIRQQLQDIDIKFTPFEKALEQYINTDSRKLAEDCYGLIKHKLQHPCLLELIWNYWHEESMMVQGIGTIARRFQNIRGEEPIDPLANLEIGPLRTLNNLLWGYIQDEQHRLTVRRRAYEYHHHYGITLQGKAVSGLRPADSRSKFIEAFHVLLNLCVKFYKQYDDTTVVADGFPVMNALKEVHLILSEGAHNQYGDLPSTSRIEMLMQQYLLARPELRDFLTSRQMVAYPEAWMDRVAALNQMHNWTKTNVLHYRDLGVFGEQIILSIRFGAWSTVFNRDQAANWAIFWRPQIQNYIHAYRAVSGVDLSREDGRIDVQQPSYHLVRRLKEQNSSKLTRQGNHQ
jgi:hypothetical protein